VGDLLDYFADRVKLENGTPSETFSKRPVNALVSLNFLRAAVALAAILAFAGAAIVARVVSPTSDPQPGLTFGVFLVLAALVGWAWWALNWFLSLASVFAARDGEDAIGAVAAAFALCRGRAGAVFAVSAWTGVMHIAVFAGATTTVFIGLGMITVVPWRLVAGGIVLVTLAYFLVADWLYVARLAGYVGILELPDVPVFPAPLPPIPLRNESIGSVQATIDFEEPILSDIPGVRALGDET
jgi:hypothetical protein